MLNRNLALLSISSMMFFGAIGAADAPAAAKPDLKVMPAEPARPVDKDMGVRPDLKIQADVLEVLKVKFPGFTPTIKVVKGDVELKGKVKDADMKKGIEGEVKKISGVKTVIVIMDK